MRDLKWKAIEEDEISNITSRITFTDGIPWVPNGDICRWLHTTFPWESNPISAYQHDPSRYNQGNSISSTLHGHSTQNPQRNKIDLRKPYSNESTSLDDLVHLNKVDESLELLRENIFKLFEESINTSKSQWLQTNIKNILSKCLHGSRSKNLEDLQEVAICFLAIERLYGVNRHSVSQCGLLKSWCDDSGLNLNDILENSKIILQNRIKEIVHTKKTKSVTEKEYSVLLEIGWKQLVRLMEKVNAVNEIDLDLLRENILELTEIESKSINTSKSKRLQIHIKDIIMMYLHGSRSKSLEDLQEIAICFLAIEWLYSKNKYRRSPATQFGLFKSWATKYKYVYHYHSYHYFEDMWKKSKIILQNRIKEIVDTGNSKSVAEEKECSVLLEIGWKQLLRWMEEDIAKEKIDRKGKNDSIPVWIPLSREHLIQGQRLHEHSESKTSLMNLPIEMKAFRLLLEAPRAITIEERKQRSYNDPTMLSDLEAIIESFTGPNKDEEYGSNNETYGSPLLSSLIEEDKVSFLSLMQNLASALSQNKLNDVVVHHEKSTVLLFGSQVCCANRNEEIAANFDCTVDQVTEYATERIPPDVVHTGIKYWVALTEYANNIRTECVWVLHELIGRTWSSYYQNECCQDWSLFTRYIIKYLRKVAQNSFNFPTADTDILGALLPWCNSVIHLSSNSIELVDIEKFAANDDVEILRALSVLLQFQSLGIKFHNGPVPKSLFSANPLQYPLASKAMEDHPSGPFGSDNLVFGPITFNKQRILKLAKKAYLINHKSYREELKTKRSESIRLFTVETAPSLFCSFIDNHNRWSDKFQQLLGIGAENHLAAYASLDIFVSKLNEQIKRQHPTKDIPWATVVLPDKNTDNKQAQEGEFQWKSLLLPKRRPVNPRVWKQFFVAHAINVRKMQALLDDPILAVTSKQKISLTKLERFKLVDGDQLLNFLLEWKKELICQVQQVWKECWRSLIEGDLHNLYYGDTFESNPILVTAKWTSIMEEFWTLMRSSSSSGQLHQSWTSNLEATDNFAKKPSIASGLQYVFSQMDKMQKVWFTPCEQCTFEFDMEKMKVSLKVSRFSKTMSKDIRVPTYIQKWISSEESKIIFSMKYNENKDTDPKLKTIYSSLKNQLYPFEKRWVWHRDPWRRVSYETVIGDLPNKRKVPMQLELKNLLPISIKNSNYLGNHLPMDLVVKLLVIFQSKYASTKRLLPLKKRIWKRYPDYFNDLLVVEDEFDYAAHAIKESDMKTLNTIFSNTQKLLVEEVSFDQTLLDIALMHKTNISIVEFMISKGASLTNVDRFGRTPLIHALRYATDEVVQFIVDQPTVSFLADSSGLTPLHWLFRRLAHEENHTLIDYFLSLKSNIFDLFQKNNAQRDVILDFFYFKYVESKIFSPSWSYDIDILKFFYKQLLARMKSVVPSFESAQMDAAVDVETITSRLGLTSVSREWCDAVLNLCRSVDTSLYTTDIVSSAGNIRINGSVSLGNFGVLIFMIEYLLKNCTKLVSYTCNREDNLIFICTLLPILVKANKLIDLAIPNNIDDNTIEPIVRDVASCTILRSLKLNSFQLTAKSIVPICIILSSFEFLTSLSLASDSISDADFHGDSEYFDEASAIALADLIAKSKSLKNLELTKCKFAENCFQYIIEAISKNIFLKSVDVDNVVVTEFDVTVFIQCFSAHPTIEELNASLIYPSVREGVALAAIVEKNKVLTKLKILDKEHQTNLTNEDIIDVSKAYAQAFANNNLTALEKFEGISLGESICREILQLDEYFRKVSNKQILSYLRESRTTGAVTVKRVRVIFVGNGETGKTTLIRRLRENTFDEHALIMTDGIDISYLKLDDLEMTIFDFAGQPEYEHTHPLFFDEKAVYLLLHNPRVGALDRLKIFLEMILNSASKAQIILVTARADEARMTDEEVENVMSWSSNIKHYIPIDSKSKYGIDELKQTMIDLAFQQPDTVKTIPRSFERLRNELTKFSLTRFRVSLAEIQTLCKDRFKIQGGLVDLALDLFIAWGYVYRLSNGDIVLHPQQLANVMSAVFTKVETTKKRIGDVHEGVLRHSDNVLDAIWSNKFPNLEKSMWRCTEKDPISPFLALIYQSGLAFQLFNDEGKPMKVPLNYEAGIMPDKTAMERVGISLVPALLPHHPAGYESYQHKLENENKKKSTPPGSSLSYGEILCKIFIPADLSMHATLMLSFVNVFPTAFFGQLQVRLRRMAVLGGNWKRGCCLALKEENNDRMKSSTGKANENKMKRVETNDHEELDSNEVKIQSMVIIYQSSDTTLHFYSAGSDTSTRSAAITAMLDLMEKKYPFMKLPEVKLKYKEREYNQFDIEENLFKGFIEHKQTHQKISITSLRVFFPEKLALPIIEEDSEGTTYDEEGEEEANTNHSINIPPLQRKISRNVSTTFKSFNSSTIRDPKNNEYWKGCPPHIIKKLAEFERNVEQAELDIQQNDENDVVYLSDCLLECIPSFLALMGLKAKKRGLSTLWVIVGDNKSQKLCTIPLSPTRLQGNDAWHPLIDEARIEVTDNVNTEEYRESKEGNPWRTWVSYAAASLVQRTFKVLEVPFGKWSIRPYMVLTDVYYEMKRKEMRFFQEIDGVFLMTKYSESVNRMLIANQVNKITVQVQAQECMLVKIIDQNIQTHESLERVEKATFKINEQLKIGFADISRELREVGNEEGLQELKTIWNSKMEVLETLIRDGDTKTIEKLMKKLEMLMNANLIDLNLDSSEIIRQIQEVQKQLTEAAHARDRGEQHAQEQLQQILQEMKGLQFQLDRVELQVQRLFEQMDMQFHNIRNQLQTNYQGLLEIRTLWMKKVEELEVMLSNIQSNQNDQNKILITNQKEFQSILEKQIKKFELMMDAKLFDLDIENHSMRDHILSIQTELLEAEKLRQLDAIEGSKRWNMVFTELKCMQTKLMEIVYLQKETANNLKEGLKSMKQFIVDVNIRTHPTTFIITASLPIIKEDSTHLSKMKAALSHMYELYNAVTHPRDAVISLLKDTYYVALICEACRCPPSDPQLWYPVTKPREVVGKILPLANAGLQFASMANAVSGLGRIFGLPTPVLQDKTFEDAQSFLDKLGKDSLESFPALQQEVQLMYESADGGDGNKNAQATAGFCIREFGLFLHQVDPKKTWARLSHRINDTNGDLCFVCPECLNTSYVNTSTAKVGLNG
eukprot:gene4126-5880_t